MPSVSALSAANAFAGEQNPTVQADEPTPPQISVMSGPYQGSSQHRPGTVNGNTNSGNLYGRPAPQRQGGQTHDGGRINLDHSQHWHNAMPEHIPAVRVGGKFLVEAKHKDNSVQNFTCSLCGKVHLIPTEWNTSANGQGKQPRPEDFCHIYGNRIYEKINLLPYNKLFGYQYPRNFSEEPCRVCGFRHLNDVTGQLCLHSVPVSALNQIKRRDYSSILRQKGLAWTAQSVAMMLKEQGDEEIASVMLAHANDSAGFQ